MIVIKIELGGIYACTRKGILTFETTCEGVTSKFLNMRWWTKAS
ncbi:unnamed protein product, partial [Vitis vinifera]